MVPVLVTDHIGPGYGSHRSWSRITSVLITDHIRPGYGSHRSWLRIISVLVTDHIGPGCGSHRSWLRITSGLKGVSYPLEWGLGRQNPADPNAGPKYLSFNAEPKYVSFSKISIFHKISVLQICFHIYNLSQNISLGSRSENGQDPRKPISKSDRGL